MRWFDFPRNNNLTYSALKWLNYPSCRSLHSLRCYAMQRNEIQFIQNVLQIFYYSHLIRPAAHRISVQCRRCFLFNPPIFSPQSTSMFSLKAVNVLIKNSTVTVKKKKQIPKVEHSDSRYIGAKEWRTIQAGDTVEKSRREAVLQPRWLRILTIWWTLRTRARAYSQKPAFVVARARFDWNVCSCALNVPVSAWPYWPVLLLSVLAARCVPMTVGMNMNTYSFLVSLLDKAV